MERPLSSGRRQATVARGRGVAGRRETNNGGGTCRQASAPGRRSALRAPARRRSFQIRVWNGDEILLHVIARRNDVQQVRHRETRTPRIVERPAGFLGEADEVGMRQRDGLLGAGAALFIDHELHVDGVGVANRDGVLQPLEETWNLRPNGSGPASNSR